ncbi:hypothetical protein [Flavobacterium piscis]|uniref:Uncharacterized protein n=1 Tax=Flavobacterium piscis TaxID=1114874 RepID=A0ABX2XM70_9FLAO|nr:hypothetical protein [Flavobacterium piscis]OCB76763.1 hypothetical protein FLP_05395 [Flavobacterium piscis]
MGNDKFRRLGGCFGMGMGQQGRDTDIFLVADPGFGPNCSKRLQLLSGLPQEAEAGCYKWSNHHLLLGYNIFFYQTLQDGISLLFEYSQHKIAVDIQHTHRQTV